MASGKPVIFSVKAANNPVKEAGCGITVPPRNPSALAEAIITLYKMPRESREEMGRKGLKYVAENHDISILAERLEHVIESVENHK
jgi:glycosyltransferase involved in cell wall biosynthesis